MENITLKPVSSARVLHLEDDRTELQTAQQSALNDSRMNSEVLEDIVMESHGHKLWVTSRRRRSISHKSMLKSIAVYPLYPDTTGA